MTTRTPTLSISAGQELVVSLLTVARRLRSRLPEGRIDPAMMFVLHHVQARGSLRVSELAACMGLDASTASRHIRQLESGGYLARTDDPGDRRASQVRLTRRGRAALDQAMRA
ncbi:MAG TPA: MarR family transcriptional regulator, partial [Actinomycetota bacterium]|nr:MarR family transcriptional regulator [Actinomycetota bacterium]